MQAITLAECPDLHSTNNVPLRILIPFICYNVSIVRLPTTTVEPLVLHVVSPLEPTVIISVRYLPASNQQLKEADTERCLARLAIDLHQVAAWTSGRFVYRSVAGS